MVFTDKQKSGLLRECVKGVLKNRKKENGCWYSHEKSRDGPVIRVLHFKKVVNGSFYVLEPVCDAMLLLREDRSCIRVYGLGESPTYRDFELIDPNCFEKAKKELKKIAQLYEN